MGKKRTRSVYWLLLAVLAVIVVWEVVEHRRVKLAARDALLIRAHDIANTLGVVVRSQRQLVPRNRLEAALEELAESDELVSVALINIEGETLAAGGEPIPERLHAVAEGGFYWQRDTLMVVDLVDLGHSMGPDDATRPAPIVLPAWEPGSATAPLPGATRPAGPPRPPRPPDEGEPAGEFAPRPPGGEARPRDATAPAFANREGEPEPGPRTWRGRRPFGRPPWISEQDYANLLKEKGLHSFVLVLSTRAYRDEIARDIWLRMAIVAFSAMAMLGLGLAWRNLVRSADLEMRLVRAGELNLRLREMNLAAVGLAHETRNPLNIVRGLAQLISRQADAGEEIRARSLKITEEVDRVTSRLNEFIESSRPPTPRPGPTALYAVLRDVERALEGDREEKDVQLALSGPDLVLDADAALLRQVLFNLILNAVQAVEPGGRVEVTVEKDGKDTAALEVRDNGPGVPPELRESIFRPYFTTRDKGTGLGLAVVRQIVLAHQWEVECMPGTAGARFRLSGLKLAPKAD